MLWKKINLLKLNMNFQFIKFFKLFKYCFYLNSFNNILTYFFYFNYCFFNCFINSEGIINNFLIF